MRARWSCCSFCAKSGQLTESANSDPLPRSAVIADRAVTAGWLSYPMVLFLAPNSWQLAGAGPETWVALIYLTLFVASSLLYDRPVGVLNWGAGIPVAVLIFAGLYSVGVLARGDLVDAVRLLSWLAVMFLGSQLLRPNWLRVKLWGLWAVTGSITALVVMSTRPIPMPEVVDVFAWEHRTVLAYYLVGGLFSAIHLQNTSQQTRSRVAASLAGAIILLALIVSLARGAWIATVLGSLVLYRARLGKLAGVAILFIPVAIFASILFGAVDDISTRLISIVDFESASSSLYRLNLYTAAFRSLPETWLAGAPVLEHGPYLAQFSPVIYPHFFSQVFATDSDVIFILLSGGVPLLLALGWAFIRFANLARVAIRVGHEDAPMLGAMLALSATQALFDNLLSSALGWFYLGVLCALATSIKSSSRVPASPATA